MKCEIAAALVHRPKILFLDEPTIGLDVTMHATVRIFIRNYNENHGATLVLRSHQMSDVVATCIRVTIVDDDTVSYDGTLDVLARRVKPETRFLRSSRPLRATICCVSATVRNDAHEAVIQVERARMQSTLVTARATLPVNDITIETPNLEGAMRELFATRRAEQGEVTAVSRMLNESA